MDKILKKIKKRLRYLYPDADEILSKLINSINKYQNDSIIKLKNKKYNGKIHLTEKDSILITYADTLQGNEKSLKTLHKFLKKYVGKSISGIHILPFFPYSSDDGFSIIDYKRVNPKFGDWSDIKVIAKDYRLMVDLVINHVSRESKWFKEFIKGNKKYKDYFIHFDKKVNTSSVFRPRTNPLLTKVNTKFGTKYVWTTFSSDQIDLNFKNPSVLLEMVDILLFYLKNGAEIIRLDAIAYLWKELGTSCIHLRKTHEIVKLLRDILDYIAPYAIIITETNVPHKDNISYFGEADLVYQFLFPPIVYDAFIRTDSRYLQKIYKKLESINGIFFNFLASHDGIGVLSAKEFLTKNEFNSLLATTKKHNGFISYKSIKNKKVPYELNVNYFDAINNPNVKKSAVDETKKFIASQAILLLTKGIPGIYIHSLLGSRNYVEGVKKTGIKRKINRETINFDKLQSTLKNKSSIKHLTLNNYLQLINSKKNIPALNPYVKEKIISSDKRLVITQRTFKNKKIIVIINISDAIINLQKYKKKFDLFSKKKFDGEARPYGVYCLE